MQLVRYEQARAALAECKRVDEVKDIRDKAEAMAAYARLAKDSELIQWATEIKVRAERQAGALIVAKRESGEMASSGGDRKSEIKIEQTTLKTYGITSDQGVRWTTLASMPEEHFEASVATAKETAGQVTTAFMLREASKAAPKLRPKARVSALDRRRLEALEASKTASALTGLTKMILVALRGKNSLTEPEREALGQLRTEIDEALEVYQR